MSRLYRYLIFALIFISTNSFGWSNEFLSTDELSLDVYKIDDYRDVYYEEDMYNWTYGTALNWNVNLLWLFKWENKVHMAGTDSQVRAVGWEYKVSLPLFPYVTPFYYHHSQHVMERGRDRRTYPLSNFYGVTLDFYRRK